MSDGCRETVVVVPPPAEPHGIVCGIWRSLDGPADAEPVASAVPANVYACLNLVAVGQVITAQGLALPARFVTGPMSRPLLTLARAPLKSASIVLQPWLLPTLFGGKPRSWVDRCGAPDALEVTPPGLTTLLDRCAESPEALSAALAAWVDALQPADSDGPRLTEMLANAGTVAAAAAALRLSERQFERRFTGACGLTPRRWLTIRRYEHSLVQLAQDGQPLVEVAAEAGFADQAHMTRVFRDVAARTPAQTRRGVVAPQPGDWPLRPAQGLRRR